jgi:hypothetical protein
MRVMNPIPLPVLVGVGILILLMFGVNRRSPFDK